MKTAILLAVSLTTFLSASEIEPGPESGGLRMKLIVNPTPSGYDVRLEIKNVSEQRIVMKADWWYDTYDGNFDEFIEAALSIETNPSITPWTGQVMAPHRTITQPQQLLAAGETWSMSWKSEGNKLKTRSIDPLSVHNPEFPFPGLYSVHGSLKLTILDEENVERTVKLRSNEQLVSVGGSTAAPKHTYGRLGGANEEDKTATILLGKLQQIENGDEFEIVTGMGQAWKLTIIEVHEESSFGKLEVLRKHPRINRAMLFPAWDGAATLIFEEAETASN